MFVIYFLEIIDPPIHRSTFSDVFSQFSVRESIHQSIHLETIDPPVDAFL